MAEDNLLPKPRAILDTIKDHPQASFDYLKRHFISTPDSTLHYHLQQLQKKGLVKRLGTTRGALYSPI